MNHELAAFFRAHNGHVVSVIVFEGFMTVECHNCGTGEVQVGAKCAVSPAIDPLAGTVKGEA